VRGVLGGLLQGRHDHVLDLVQQDRRRPARPRLIYQPVQPPLGEPAPPPRHCRLGHPQLPGDLLIAPASGAGQDDLRPQRQCLGGLRPPRPPGQLVPLGISQHQPCLRPARPGAVREPAQPVLSEPRPPLPHRLSRKSQATGPKISSVSSDEPGETRVRTVGGRTGHPGAPPRSPAARRNRLMAVAGTDRLIGRARAPVACFRLLA
jgi:hypothetical protein